MCDIMWTTMECIDCGVREAHDASRRVLRPCRCAHEQVKHMHEVRDVQSAHVWSPLLGGHTPPCWEHAWRGGEVDGHPTHPEVARLRALATAVGAVGWVNKKG